MANDVSIFGGKNYFKLFTGLILMGGGLEPGSKWVWVWDSSHTLTIPPLLQPPPPPPKISTLKNALIARKSKEKRKTNLVIMVCFSFAVHDLQYVQYVTFLSNSNNSVHIPA